MLGQGGMVHAQLRQLVCESTLRTQNPLNKVSASQTLKFAAWDFDKL